MKRPSISLIHKALLAVTLVLLPILITFLYTYSQNKEMLKEHALKNLAVIAELSEAQVYQLIEMEKKRAQDFSSDGFIRERLQRVLKGDKSAAASLNAHLVKNKLPLDKNIEQILILSMKGMVAASTNGRIIGQDVSKEIFFTREKAGWNIIEKNVVTAASSPAFAVSNPITDKDTGELIGSLVNFVALSAFNHTLNGSLAKESGAISPGIKNHLKTLEVYLVNKNGLMLTDSLFIKDAISKQRVDTLPVQKCINENKEHGGFYKGYRGIEVAGASMCLPKLKWTLLAEVDSDEILAPVRIMRKSAIITASIVAALIFMLFVLFFRGVILPLRRASRSAEAIANGEYDIDLPVETKDEIGALSASFNIMAYHVKSRTELLKQSEEKLRAMLEIQQKYEELLNNLNVGIYRRMADGQLVEANPAAVAMFEAGSKEELAKYNVAAFYQDKNRLKEVTDKLLKYGSVKDEEMKVLTAKGRPFWCSLSAVTKKDKDGTVYIDGIVEDITEKRMLEEQLRHSQKMEAIGQLAGGIAHDFNNILTAIIGYGNLLLRKKQGDDMVKDYVGEMLGAANRAANLTKDLLSFSRKHIIATQPFDLNELVKKTEKILVRVIGEHIEIKATLADKNLVVKIDPAHIEQALLNLATNARDAMPDGGRLLITTDMATIDNSFIIAHGYGKTGRYAILTFADTGVGMSREIQSRSFEPFFTTKEVGKGTGLGLSTVYGVVKQHGGYINVYSEPGHGTAFKIYLPMAGDDVVQVEEKALPDILASKGNMETILIAEDDPETRKITKAVLEEYNYKVIEAENGEDAVNKFTANKDEIRLVILDMIMPKKGGLEAYKEIRKINPSAKVIFLSGYTGDMIKMEDINREGLVLISKPVSPNELSIKIKEALDK